MDVAWKIPVGVCNSVPIRRGSPFREGFHDLSIDTGLQVYPALVAAEHRGRFMAGRSRAGLLFVEHGLAPEAPVARWPAQGLVDLETGHLIRGPGSNFRYYCGQARAQRARLASELSSFYHAFTIHTGTLDPCVKQRDGFCGDEDMTTLDQKYAPIIICNRDDFGSNRSSNRPLLELAKVRMSRRAALKGFVTTAVVGALGGTLTSRVALAGGSSFGFESVPHTIADDMQVAPGYTAQVLIRWGDPVLPGAPAFDPMNQTADAQAKQFGYNNDFVGYFPLPRGSDSSEHGLLHVNHEYTGPQLMFPGWTKEGADADAIGEASLAAQTPEQSAIEMMAHGGAVIEIIKENGRWRVVEDSQYARRITPETEMTLSGPAAATSCSRPAPTPPAPRCWARSTTAPAARHPGAPC